MLTVKFQKAKTGGHEGFQLSMSDPELILAEAAKDRDVAVWMVDKCLRIVNQGIKLIDESGSIWTAEKAVSIFRQGMAVSNSCTWTAEDFQAQWAGGLREVVECLVDVAKLDKAKAVLAVCVRHGGKATLTESQCSRVIELFGSAAGEHEVIAVAVANAKTRLGEIVKADAALDF